MPVRLVVVPFRVEEDGREIVTFAFAPDESAQQSSTSGTEMAHA
jgi:hypothetical protein